MKDRATLYAFAALVIVLLTAAACQAPAPPPPTDWAAAQGPLVDTYVDAWSTGNLDQLDAVMSADLIRTAPPSGPGNANSLAEMKDIIAAFRAGWPNTNVVLDENYHMENVSFHRWTFTGTNTGEGDTPPTGAAAKVSGFTLIHYADGKIAEEHVQFDSLDFMQQLGFTLGAPEAESG